MDIDILQSPFMHSSLDLSKLHISLHLNTRHMELHRLENLAQIDGLLSQVGRLSFPSTPNAGGFEYFFSMHKH
jgi:hypothetical protein